ncbi:Hypothetical predicted protein [Pelobates cultripes]|uniref:Uncharacterized protein n=1 Tax=Pelobates cultripes TaxID=61616 RepID=A0AAD1SPA8_PELCU|nr:Hypothetical predicted protein [Pelobates cultripes]
MAAASDPDSSRTQMQQHDLPDPSNKVRDTLDVIFDRFWAKLLTRIGPAMTTPIPTEQDHVRTKRRSGKPLQGAKQYPTSAIPTRCPSKLRATRVITQRHQPHRCKATRHKRRHTVTNCRTHRTIPTGKTQDLTGPQARVKRVPALIQHRGWRATRCCIFPPIGLSPSKRNNPCRGVG